uniref:Stringent starvation protein B n=1 Tax=Candidatus Kentrum sp. DK TaxID=2126562 RepID=A0A450SC65_9GAMM|nr:MAG: stringent starvation protein B [Candidatus Kentron sp. DK]VFJ49866.1 MAG: stringent starvation protein B [Candidatus Kentron sp. DK]
MRSTRPYLIRAMHEWMLDNNLTPYLLVNTEVAGVSVPPRHIEENRITLNVSYSATKNLRMGNEQIDFSARFQGTPVSVQIPTQAVLAIYAKETGAGMAFQEESSVESQQEEETGNERTATPPKPPVSGDGKPSRPVLRIVK